MRMSGLIWRESRNSPKEIPPRYMVVLEKKYANRGLVELLAEQTDLDWEGCW